MARGVLLGTLIVGVLDITEVIMFYAFRGVEPERVLQGVAAGLLGRSAFRGGWSVALLGLAIHFAIALVVVTIYHAGVRQLAAARAAGSSLPAMIRHPWIGGALYGLAVYTVMNFIVLPLSAAGPPSRSWPIVANLLFAHVVCVGIPAAMTVRLSAPRDARRSAHDLRQPPP
jgi:hypothetical protein